jgi:hypothetical protein
MPRTASTNPTFIFVPRAGRGSLPLGVTSLATARLRRERARWSGLAEVVAGAGLLVLWALLWSLLVGGVVAPAGRLVDAGARSEAARASQVRGWDGGYTATRR